MSRRESWLSLGLEVFNITAKLSAPRRPRLPLFTAILEPVIRRCLMSYPHVVLDGGIRGEIAGQGSIYPWDLPCRACLAMAERRKSS